MVWDADNAEVIVVILDDFPFVVSLAEAADRVRLDRDDPENAGDLEALERLVEKVNRIARPKVLIRELTAREIPPDGLELNGKKFSGRIFRSICLPSSRVWAVCLTCGTETAVLEPELDILERYWLEELRMLLLGCARDAAHAYLQQAAGAEKLATVAPGAGPADLWPLTQMADLFELMGGRTLPIGVRLTDSMLMLPEKSSAAICFASEHSYAGCLYCQRTNCPQRRAAYDPDAEKQKDFGL